MIDLTGKSAVVTGGSRGIGRAIALRLATQGADVAFSYRGNAAAAEETAAAIRALGRVALAIQADHSQPEAGDIVVKAALEAFGTRLPTGAALRVPQTKNRAAALARLARSAWRRGESVDAALALPLYLRDKVASTTAEREADALAKSLA